MWPDHVIETYVRNMTIDPKVDVTGATEERLEQPLRIAEIFQSRQGEGILTGTESVFIRVSGCNLRCKFCDTPYASWEPEGPLFTVEEILQRVESFPARHVVLTGGEPMLFPQVVSLTRHLSDRGYHVTVETAGTVYRPVHCHLMSISPKLSNSTPDRETHPRWWKEHELRRHQPEVIRRFIREYPYQIKFVIDQPEDVDEVERYLAAILEIDRDRVLLMPQGTDQESLGEKMAWLDPLCQQHGFKLCPRKHIEWYGPGRGK
ncbi:7-carboxy-7-deazaguanine synthase QueE [Thermogutta sp.]|uniref:7-carboxy-7-deazaguanine synthase QueE n=1 Tax=Thermogutta sp. TaxID=1962930 RepID=UPI00321FD496